MAKNKLKVKYDRWFLIVLTILTWALCNQLFALTSWLPVNWADISLWLRVVANLIALFGVLWVLKMYIINTRRQARRKEHIAEVIKNHPELADVIKEIMEK